MKLTLNDFCEYENQECYSFRYKIALLNSNNFLDSNNFIIRFYMKYAIFHIILHFLSLSQERLVNSSLLQSNMFTIKIV